MGDDAPAAVERDIRFPRIDGEQTPEIRRFNELVAQQPQFRSGRRDQRERRLYDRLCRPGIDLGALQSQP